MLKNKIQHIRHIDYKMVLMTILTLCTVIYVGMDIYKYKRRNKLQQQIKIENVLGNQDIRYETEEDMDKFRNIIFNLEETLRDLDVRITDVDARVLEIESRGTKK